MMNDYEKELIKRLRAGMYGAMLIETIIVLCATVLLSLIFRSSSLFFTGVGLCVVINVCFFVNGMKRINAITKNPPIECEVYDFVIDFCGKGYGLIPIFRNVVTGELYYTFYKYDFSLYKIILTKTPEQVSEMKILRENNTELLVGDHTFLYIKRYFDPKLHIEPNDDHYFLDNENYLFRNTVPEHDISVMKELKFFEGYVDIEQQKEGVPE